MSEYPNGIYRASWGGSMTDVVRLETARDDEQWVQGTRFGGWLREHLLSGMVLTPLVPALTEPTLAAIRELCNCVDVVAAAPFAMPELAGAYLDDVATVRAWLDSYRERTA